MPPWPLPEPPEAARLQEKHRKTPRFALRVVRALDSVRRCCFFVSLQTATRFLYVTTAGATDLGEATGPRSRYREDPKCQEWEELMDADFHGGWTALDEVHASDREWVGALR